MCLYFVILNLFQDLQNFSPPLREHLCKAQGGESQSDGVVCHLQKTRNPISVDKNKKNDNVGLNKKLNIMTNQEKLQLSLALKAYNDEYVLWFIFSAASQVVISICVIGAGEFDRALIFGIGFTFFLIYCASRANRSLNKLISCQKKLEQYAKEGKSFDDAYLLLFE